ncbi:MAG: hypothetical protein AVDCRST_MAG76-1871, partial [uncultured Acidimicrobiales bacterium]
WPTPSGRRDEAGSVAACRRSRHWPVTSWGRRSTPPCRSTRTTRRWSSAPAWPRSFSSSCWWRRGRSSPSPGWWWPSRPTPPSTSPTAGPSWPAPPRATCCSRLAATAGPARSSSPFRPRRCPQPPGSPLPWRPAGGRGGWTGRPTPCCGRRPPSHHLD